MPKVEGVLKYARSHAAELEKDMHLVAAQNTFGSYWDADNDEVSVKITARITAAVQFLREYAGAGSVWAEQASKAGSDASDARKLAALLREWSAQVEVGIIEIAGSRAWAEVGVVSTDIMGQVRRLLEDRAVHPAAPVVLCGAALETALRAVAQARNVTIPARSPMNAVVSALRSAQLLSVQDVKDFESVGGIRNQAAHGEFDRISAERAGLMEQQTNILLRLLADLMQQP